VRVLLDGREYFRYDKPAGAGKAEWPFDAPFHLLLNVAVGGAWGGEKGIDESTLPYAMTVDYVRVYQRALR
jgi:beta-glucanase (GH16 family)